MIMRNYLATFNNLSILPPGSIYRGGNKFDFMAEETLPLPPMKEKLIELREDATVVYKKAGETIDIRVKLKKDGRSIAKNKEKIRGSARVGAEVVA